MLTLESKFSEFVKMFMGAGACSDAKPYTDSLIKDDATLEETISAYEKFENKNDTFVAWFIKKFGEQIETKLRERYIITIKDPMIAVGILKECTFLSREEQTILDTIAKNETEIQKIINATSEPIEAARLLIDHPHLTDVQEIELKAKFKGQLPTVEKELLTGVVITAKSQVVK